MMAEFGGNSGKQSAFYRIANITIQNSANRRFNFKWNTIIYNPGILTNQETVMTTRNPHNLTWWSKGLNKFSELTIWQKNQVYS